MSRADFSGIQALIFDLDGTLIDSKQDLVISINAMLRQLGRGELPADVIASYVGPARPCWCDGRLAKALLRKR